MNNELLLLIMIELYILILLFSNNVDYVSKFSIINYNK